MDNRNSTIVQPPRQNYNSYSRDADLNNSVYASGRTNFDGQGLAYGLQRIRRGIFTASALTAAMSVNINLANHIFMRPENDESVKQYEWVESSSQNGIATGMIGISACGFLYTFEAMSKKRSKRLKDDDLESKIEDK